MALLPGLMPLIPGLWLYPDAANVYVLQYEDGSTVLFDLGSGDVLAAMEAERLPAPSMVFHTDYRRDRTFGHYAHPDLPVAVGEIDKDCFARAEDLWREVSVYHAYGGYDRFLMPRRDIPVAMALHDGQLPIWKRPYVYTEHTPAFTPGEMSYTILYDDKRYLVCGDLLQADGRLHSIYELQRNYNFMEGLNGVRRAAAWMASGEFDGVLPSHGEPILGRERVREAAERLIERIDGFHERWRLIWPDQPPGGINDFDAVTPHLRAATNRISYALTDDDGNAILFDTGVGYADGFEQTLAEKGIRNIEYVLITHHHDDHLMGWDWLKQHYSPKLGTHECMVDILRNPRAYALNCLYDAPLPVDLVLKEGEVFEWRGYRIECYHFPSQTEYHCIYFVVVDGRRVLISGDALYWERGDKDIRPTDPDWRNRFDVDCGYLVCAPIVERLRPDLLAAAHVYPWDIEPGAIQRFTENAKEFHESLRDLVGRKHPTLGIDPFWISVYPYRATARAGERVRIEVRVDNPLDREATIAVTPEVPAGVRVDPVGVSETLPPKAHVRVPFDLFIDSLDGIQGRAVYTLDIDFDDEPLGEVAEAMLETEDFKAPGG